MRNNLPLLDKYEKIIREDKSSLVFAPLAEIYRKSGEFKKAIKICNEGLEYNPDYISGRLVLANCYYELEDYRHAFEVIKNYIDTNLDNNMLQKTWGKINLELGNTEVALECFKKLLFIFPGDREIAELVENLEMEISPLEINVLDDSGKKIDLKNWSQKNLNGEEILIKINDETKMDFQKLLGSDHEFESTGQEVTELVPKEEDKLSKHDENLSKNLMDYFDLKAGEIDSILNEVDDFSDETNKTETAFLSLDSYETAFISEVKNRCQLFLSLLIERSNLLVPSQKI